MGHGFVNLVNQKPDGIQCDQLVIQHSVVFGWHFVFNISQQRDAHLSRVIAPEYITDIVSFDLHLDLDCFSLVTDKRRRAINTISKAPLKMPQRMFEYHNSSCARPSSGNSTKSAKGFSSKIKENCLLSADQLAIVGVMFKNILNPTFTNSATLLWLWDWEGAHFRNRFRGLSKVGASLST